MDFLKQWRRSTLILSLFAGLCGSAFAAPPETPTPMHYASGGKNIGIVLFSPAKPGKYPAIVILHGSNGPVSNFVGGYAQQLADQGFVIALIHYFDRTNTAPYPSYALMEKNFPAWTQAVRDGITYLDQNPKVEKDSIGLLGISLGGFLSTAVTNADPRVKAVVNVSGGIPGAVAKDAKKMAPTLILHGDADRTVPVQQAYELESVLKRTGTPYRIEVYPGEGHMFHGDAQFDAMTRAFSFLDEHLRTAPVGAVRR